MSATPYYRVLIDHSRNASAASRAATMGKTLSTLTDVRLGVSQEERDWWDRDTDIVTVSVSCTPFDDRDGSKRTRTRDFADRISELLGIDVRIHDNID